MASTWSDSTQFIYGSTHCSCTQSFFAYFLIETIKRSLFFFVIRTESDEDICRGMTSPSSSLGKKLANTQFNHIFIYYLIIYLFIFAIIHCVFFLHAKKTRTDIIWMDIHERQQQKPILEIRSFFPRSTKRSIALREKINRKCCIYNLVF